MRLPRVVWVIEKHKTGASGYCLIDHLYFREDLAKEAAKRFTEESVGYKFRAKPFKEITQ